MLGFVGAHGRGTAAAAAFALTAGLLLGPGSPLNPSAAHAASGPCGLLTYNAQDPPTYDHVVVVMDENLSYSGFTRSTQATYLQGLSTACGSESNMHGATHPSQSNYMALTSGVATGPTVHTASDNIFHQAQAAGDTWRDYAEAMPKNCSPNVLTIPAYKAGHTPPYWYSDLATPTKTCALYDVPMTPALDSAIASDTLPTFAWITPDLCNDMHGDPTCPVAQSSRVAAGDAWLAALLPRLTALSSYRTGKTLIVVTFDEGSEGNATGVDCTDPAYYALHVDCHIATIVLSAYVRPGAVDSGDHNLYGLLGTFEDVLGYPRLGRAVGASSLRGGLGF